MNPQFWTDRKVFLTGHTGFKGSWLSLWLQEAGANLVGYSLPPPTTPSHFVLAGIGGRMRNIEADIRDGTALASAMREFEPEIVLHLAAQSVVRISYDDPVDTYSTNVMGTVNLLEAVRSCPSVRSAVVVTSDKCYENYETSRGYNECDPLGGDDPYSASKACDEIIVESHRRSYFRGGARKIGIATVRAGNVIGGGDWTPDQLVPDTIRAFSAGRPVPLRNPGAIRPWQFVLQPLDGYLRVAERLHAEPQAYSGPWNFGPTEPEAWTVQQLVEALAREWGPTARWESDRGEFPHETGVLNLDVTRACRSLGWKPALCTGEAVKWVVEWYREYVSGGDVRFATLQQIHRYEELARI